ncbi:MAG: site-specific DNA-methyltransferase, partial [Candidatus Micrarchaeia archaeon]
MTKEQKFYEKLRDIFIGAKVEGQGGFINLMKIKSKYYQKIEFYLKADIEDALQKYPNFREELFDKLYTFFNRYFSENGSIYFNSTPFHNNIYEKVYTDNRDVILFWKTRMLYYVKTDRIFRSMPVEFDGKKFYFDATTVENKKANEKRELIYELKEVKEDKTVVFNVIYSERGRTTKTEDILKELRKKGITDIKEEDLERAFMVFEKQSEVDYFINKNAKQFLKEQFDLWLYQYLTDINTEWTHERIEQIQILKKIAYKLIDFVSQFEDELVKIWNKPKFVRNSNYVITLDRIVNKGDGLSIIEKLKNHKGWNEQVKEWIELGILESEPETLIENNQLKREYQYLPIDTKYFKDLEIEILSLFDSLDEELDGWLIKSENYQALNTILPKFKEKVQTIYIDPPFNKEQDADYLYNVKYKDSTWASILENRIGIARNLLNERGSIFVRCDYNGNWIVRPLMDEIFGRENFRNEIIIAKSKEFFKTMTHIKKFSEETESLFLYSKTDDMKYNLIYRKKEKPSKYEAFLPVEDKNYQDYREINGEIYYSPKGRKWGIKQEDIQKFLETKRLVFENGQWYIITFEEPLKNHWLDYQGYSRNWNFQTENSEILLKRVIESTSNEGDLVMDFFLGSGTTVATAHKLHRKWIGIEMGEHFYTVILPRMKKVLAYDKSGISKEKDVKEKYNKDNAGGFFKYYELEQYEDTLANTVYYDLENPESLGLFEPNKSIYEQYVFMRDEKLLKVINMSGLTDNDDEEISINIDFSKLYPDIDIAETLS